MEWINKIGRIVVLNLPKRTDRLLEITEEFENYEIPFERVSAIEDSRGAEGLRLTMVKLFEEEIEKGTEHLLVFEDDNKFVVEKFWFHDTMNKVIDSLPERYIMLFLGGQLTGKVNSFHSPHIISATKVFSTHSVLYSLQGMKEILARQMTAPIDNFYVASIEQLGRSYMTYPLLTTQRAGYSDIGNNFIDWNNFIQPRYKQKINEYHANRRS